MMSKFKQKRFWYTLLGYFIFLLVINVLVSAIDRDKSLPFINPKMIGDKVGISLLMAMIFAFGTKYDESDDDNIDEIRQRRFSYYAGYFLMLSVIMLFLGLLLLGIAFFFFMLFSDQEMNYTEMFLKPLVVLVIMILLYTLYVYISDRVKLRKRRT